MLKVGLFVVFGGLGGAILFFAWTIYNGHAHEYEAEKSHGGADHDAAS